MSDLTVGQVNNKGLVGSVKDVAAAIWKAQKETLGNIGTGIVNTTPLLRMFVFEESIGTALVNGHKQSVKDITYGAYNPDIPSLPYEISAHRALRKAIIGSEEPIGLAKGIESKLKDKGIVTY
ncbi:MAG: hypothetical protein PHX18_01630 [Candidatus Gastranaerophilales bacterium]|nr:hypothetical protein [Candidatus Gastranaerophilales bacterium]